MAARDYAIAAAVAEAVRPFGVPILGMASTEHETAYRDQNVELIPEFYAELGYDDAGNLILSRVHEAVDPSRARERVLRALREHVVSTTGGHDIAVKAATICVHSDTPAAATLVAELSRALRSA